VSTEDHREHQKIEEKEKNFFVNLGEILSALNGKDFRL